MLGLTVGLARSAVVVAARPTHTRRDRRTRARPGHAELHRPSRSPRSPWTAGPISTRWPGPVFELLAGQVPFATREA